MSSPNITDGPAIWKRTVTIPGGYMLFSFDLEGRDTKFIAARNLEEAVGEWNLQNESNMYVQKIPDVVQCLGKVTVLSPPKE